MREAVLRAFTSRLASGQAWTSVEIAALLVEMGVASSLGCGERTALSHTLRNMVAAGELQRVGIKRLPGVNRPVPLYALASVDGEAGASALELLFKAWAA